MMKSRTVGCKVASLALLLFFSNEALADNQLIHTQEPVIKLQDLINEALINNAALKSREQGGVAKEAEIGPAGSLENPEVSFEAKNYPVSSGGRTTSSMREREISLSQRVPFPGKRARLEDSARYEVKVQREGIRVERSRIIKELKNAYYKLHLEYRKEQVLSDQKNVVRSLIATARKQYSLGKVQQLDVLNLQLEEATIVGQSLTVESRIKAILGEINHLLGRSDRDKYIAGRPENIKKTPFNFDEGSEAEICERATQKNPRVVLQRAMAAVSESKLAYAKLNMWPDFDFKFAYTFRDQGDPDVQNSFSAMVGVTLPLWAGSRQSEERKGSIAENIQAGLLLKEEEIDIAHQIHVTYAELEETNRRLQLFEEATIPLSKQALTAAQSGYLTGKGEFSLLLGLIQKRSQVELEYVEALVTYELKIAELESLTGDSQEGNEPW